MVESLLGGSLAGGLLGGAFRLVPEVLSWLDKKNERAHELLLFKEQAELAKIQGDIKLREINAGVNAAIDQGVLTAMRAAVDQQVELVKASASSSGFASWMAAFSASVRPVITYWILAVWSGIHIWLAINTNLDAQGTFKLVMTPDFLALVSGTINYWFLDRTLAKRGLA
jgi:hypothetical protein